MKPPRGLSAEEAAAWARLAHSVEPLPGRERPPIAATSHQESRGAGRGMAPRMKSVPADRREPVTRPQSPVSTGPVRRVAEAGQTLDSGWDRRLARGTLAPDFTLDLHGHTLDQAHARLDRGLRQAKALGARVILLIAGKSRPVEAADRATRRGAIRAKVLDWLAAGPHGADIAAIRPAHRRHGGEGALYIILRRTR